MKLTNSLRMKSRSNPPLSPFSKGGILSLEVKPLPSINSGQAFGKERKGRFWAKWRGNCSVSFSLGTLAVVLIGLSLAGCGMFSPRSDPSRFFTVTAIAQPGTAVSRGPDSSAGVSLGIGPVKLPGYLDRQEMVVRASQNRIDLSEYDFWAEPLDNNFTRVVAQNLAVLLRTDRLVLFPWELNRRPDYQLTIEVLRFEANTRGEVQLSARWEILDTTKRIPLQAGESNVTRQPSAQSTDASVAALSEALGDMSREIAKAVNAVKGQKR